MHFEVIGRASLAVPAFKIIRLDFSVATLHVRKEDDTEPDEDMDDGDVKKQEGA